MKPAPLSKNASTSPKSSNPHIVFLITHLRGEPISTRLSDLVRRVLVHYECGTRTSIVDLVLDDALAYARKLEQQGEVTVFICARATGYYLRTHLSTPVVLLATGGSDMLDAFAKAAEISSQVGLLVHRAVDMGIERAKHLFNFSLHQRSYLTARDAAASIDELVRDGCKVIVGSPMVTEIAQRVGVHAVLSYSERAVRRALDDALALCHAELVEAGRHRRLDRVFSHLTDGVIAVDSNGAIESINQTALTMLNLGLDRENVSGMLVNNLVPELAITPLSSMSLAENERFLKLGSRSIVASMAPLLEDGMPSGYVITLQESTMVQRIDRSIRLQSRPRKDVAKYYLTDLIGADPKIVRLRQLAERYAKTVSTILINGESGTGKELLAQGVHNASPRYAQPFVAINCAALPEPLLESELFGYEEGAFTGSRRGGKIGLFEAAHQGTIFLDEIGDMPLLLQTRLLRVLQEREVHRIGALDPTPVDVRVIAATNLDLLERVSQGRFRADLYYRLNIIGLHLPPLRERIGDLPALAQMLTGKICRNLGHETLPTLEPLLSCLIGYSWPGNIRELENILECYLASFDGNERPDFETLQTILPKRLVAETRQLQVGWLSVEGSNNRATEGLRADRKQHEQEVLSQAIARCGGNYKEAAALLGISYTTLWRKMKGH